MGLMSWLATVVLLILLAYIIYWLCIKRTRQNISDTQGRSIEAQQAGVPYPNTAVCDSQQYPTYPQAGPPYPVQTAYPTVPAPYPTVQAPYPTVQAPYPTVPAPYPASVMPYPQYQMPSPYNNTTSDQQQHAGVMAPSPPSYNEVVVDPYKRQAPYNPNVSST